MNRQILTFLTMMLAGCGSSGPWDRVNAVHRVITRRHVQPPADDRLAEAAIRAMVAELDPHTLYLSSEELRWFEEDVRGTYGGVGIEVVAEGDAWRIVGVVPGGPADHAGVQVGDRVVAVNGLAPGKSDRAQLLAALRGPIGGRVVLRVVGAREASDLGARDVSLSRALVTSQSVVADEPLVDRDGIAFVRIRQFQDATQAAFDALLPRIVSAPTLRGLVLDLRGNPGGLVDVARAIADRWIAEGPIHGMAMRGQPPRQVLADEDAPLRSVPTAVLVDAATASAAELLAAALRERARALLVGERTFGKGTVQIVVPVDGGGALDVTIGEYRTACGASIQARGLEPDLVLAAGERERKPQREEDLPRALRFEGAGSSSRVPQRDPLVSVVRPSDPRATDPAAERARRALLDHISARAEIAPRECHP